MSSNTGARRTHAISGLNPDGVQELIRVGDGGYPVGYNVSSGSIDITDISPALLQRIVPQIDLDAVTATGAGTGINCELYNKAAVTVSKTGTATVAIEESFDGGTTWITATDHLGNILSDVNGIVLISNRRLSLIRTNVTSYTNGNITTTISAGN